MTSKTSAGRPKVAASPLRTSARSLRRAIRRLASYQKGVWWGPLVTVGLAAFRSIYRGERLSTSKYRFVATVRPMTEGSATVVELLPDDEAVEANPLVNGPRTAPMPPAERGFGAISWRTHLDVLLPVGGSARRTAWFAGSDLFVEESEIEVFDFRNFAAHLDLIAASRSGAVARRHDPQGSMEAAIYPGSFAPGNWYHWITETLPRIWLATRLPEELGEVPLLVHRGFLDVPAMRETLALVWEDRPVHTVHDFDWLHVERLIWVDGMFSMNHHAIYPDGLVDQASRFHPAMRDFRAHLLDRRRDSVFRAPRRVFLDRGGFARTYNDLEVKAALASRGFVVVEAGALDFADQVALFRDAEVLAGPSGAAWANLLFATEGTKALYWVPWYFAGTQIWASLGALSGVDLHEHTYQQPFGDFKSGSYNIDVPDLLDHIDRVLEDD